jgi:hypothetical protein
MICWVQISKKYLHHIEILVIEFWAKSGPLFHVYILFLSGLIIFVYRNVIKYFIGEQKVRSHLIKIIISNCVVSGM